MKVMLAKLLGRMSLVFGGVKAILILIIFFRKNGEFWVIGENYGVCLNDNGYHLYEYLKERDNVYFVVKSSSIDRVNCSDCKNLLVYGSLKHFLVLSRAKVLFFSHSPRDIIYPFVWRYLFSKTVNVFIQHGVFGLKVVNKDQKIFLNYIDVFVVSNFKERDIVEFELGVHASKICITGLPRYQFLTDKSVSSDVFILYVPTWRDWVSHSGDEPSYFRKIKEFIASEKLSKCLDDLGATLCVYLHKNTQISVRDSRFLGAGNRVRIANYRDDQLFDLIQRSRLLITDYSSVCWDFSMLGKPVMFYQFDQGEYIDNRGSYMDLNSIPIGKTYFEINDLIDDLPIVFSSRKSAQLGFGASCENIVKEIERRFCNDFL